MHHPPHGISATRFSSEMSGQFFPRLLKLGLIELQTRAPIDSAPFIFRV
jgi:hypothetical protein